MDSPLTKEYVGGATLSSMFIYLSGEAPGFGLATALDTLCSQAYGAGKPQRIGVSFQTGVLVLSAVLVPVFWLNWYSGHFLTLMQQPDDVAILAGQFSRCLLPGLPFLFLYELLKKVLQAQNIVAPMVWIAILSNIVNVALGILLTWYTPLGFQGAAIARSISNLVLPLATVPYFIWYPENFNAWWPGWQPRAVLEHVGVFLSLGIPGMFMLVLEWLSYEIMAVFAGLLPNSVVAISVHSVLSNVANIAFHFFIGVGVATNVLVGNYVGSGQKAHAKLVSSLGLVVSMGIAVGLVITITATHRFLPTMFINDDESIALASIAVLYLIPFELLDAANCVMQGVFRGTGRQTFAAVVNLVCYFVIGLPSGLLFAFKFHMGVEGFWLALSLGYLCSVGVSLWKIWTTNWDAMVEEANERTVA
jgi:MATE family multidrug resistance protein